MKSRASVGEPERHQANTVNSEPNLANSLESEDEPSSIKSRTGIGEPNREDLNIVGIDPNLANSLKKQ